MISRKEAIRMAMDADNHMNDWGQGIEMDWDAVEKLVNEAYKKGAEAEREECAKLCETEIKPCSDVRGLVINSALNWAAENIRARGHNG